MAVLSVDLACRRWSDLGIVILDRGSSGKPKPAPDWKLNENSDLGSASNPILAATSTTVRCEIVLLDPPGLDAELDRAPIDANVLAGRLNHLCGLRDIRILMLDGPQAWKSSSNGLEHARASERQLNTAAKTGLPGMVKPATYRPFAEFCIDVYEALCRRGWRRLTTRDNAGQTHLHGPQERILVESYPKAAWKSLGLTPLPSKRRARVSDLADAYAALNVLIPVTTNRPPNHDQLQAIVSGMAGLALEEHHTAALRMVGKPPRREDGHWREGFIALPVAPQPRIGMRWLN